MVHVTKYHLLPTDLIPNSPRPLLHYQGVLNPKAGTDHCDPAAVWDLFNGNEWRVNWIFRYGDTQLSHYHSQAHECMAVLSGTAKVRFGVADTSADMHDNTYGDAWEAGGVTIDAKVGDVFIIPAGVAHKTHQARPEAEFKLLTPGRGHGIEVDDPRKALSEIVLDGFTMMGAYSGGDWDFVEAGGNYEKVWSVPKPKTDPVFGTSQEGLVKTWAGGSSEVRARL